MSNNKTVAILYNEIPEKASPDDLDTIVQAELVVTSLRDLGYKTVQLPFSLDLVGVIENLRKLAPVFVFNMVESVMGQGCLSHLAPLLLDNLKIKYCGCPAEAIYLTTNKPLAKKLLVAAGISTPEWVSVADNTSFTTGMEYIIKPVSEDASIGLDGDFLVRPDSWEQLRKLLLEKQNQFDKEFFAEKYIDGREFNLSILGGKETLEVLPPAEIDFREYEALNRPKVVDYKAKWVENSFEYLNTTRTFNFDGKDDLLLAEMKTMARVCWDYFRLKGYARIDLRVDQHGRPWVLEVNPNPCLTPGSGYMAAATQAGLSFADVLKRIIADQ